MFNDVSPNIEIMPFRMKWDDLWSCWQLMKWDDLWSCWQFGTISMLGFQHRDSQVLQVSPGHIMHGSRSQVQHQQASCTSQVDSVQHKLRAAVHVAPLEFYNVSWNMNIAYLKID